jgi:Ni/Fe-hydrogenase 1 B-type cytochrome subunit
MGSKAFETHQESQIYVYEVPVRLWHWINAAAITVLCVTGYFIGSPLPSMPGEASDWFVMGYIRFAHFAAGYLVAVLFMGRIYWAIVGNNHAREIFLPPIWRLSFWGGVWHEILWYCFLAKEPRKYTGHNPLAALMMHFVFIWGIVFMIFTGFALYGEGAGMGSWQYEWFSSWIIPLFGQSQDVHTWHHLIMWWIICFIIIHVYVAVREDIMSRQSIISSMISGWRGFRDARKPDDEDFG